MSVIGPGGEVLANGETTATIEVDAGSHTLVVTSTNSRRANYTLTVTHY